MFSMRPSASTECSASRARTSPARSTMASTTSASSPEKWRAASIVPVNSASAERTFAPRRPVLAIASSQAEKNETPSSAASSRILLIEVVPMPRRGAC